MMQKWPLALTQWLRVGSGWMKVRVPAYYAAVTAACARADWHVKRTRRAGS